MTTLILLTIAGAIIASVVSSFWYSMSTPMGRLHAEEVGFDKLTPEERERKITELKPHMWKSYLGYFLLSLLVSFSTVFILRMSVQNGVSFTLALGFVLSNWLCFMVPVIGSNIIWGAVDRKLAWKKFVSDISNYLVVILLIALLTYFFI